MDDNSQQIPQAGGQQPAYQPQQPQQPGQPAGQPGQDGQPRLRIDDNMLRDLGLGDLPPQEKNRLLAQIYETLELRVGMTLANQMSDQQLQEFEGFIDSNDERGALTWLEGNFPNYKQVVANELEKLKQEISANAQQIIDAVNNPAAPQDQPAQGQYPQQQPQQPGQSGQPQQPGQTYDPNQPQ